MSDDGIQWIGGTPDEMAAAQMDALIVRIDDAVFELAQFFAPQIEAWMKQNANWTDQTGNARQSLYADVQRLIHGAAITMGDGMDYFKFLVYANAGRYDILGPSLDFWSVQLFNAVQGLGVKDIGVGTSQSTGL